MHNTQSIQFSQSVNQSIKSQLYGAIISQMNQRQRRSRLRVHASNSSYFKLQTTQQKTKKTKAARYQKHTLLAVGVV